MCMCVRVCVCEKLRERKRESRRQEKEAHWVERERKERKQRGGIYNKLTRGKSLVTGLGEKERERV